MIPYNGEPMHGGTPAYVAIQTYLRAPKREAVPETQRCVNEEAPGCAGRAEENGWCAPCWATIVPPPLAPAVTEPSETGCGRR